MVFRALLLRLLHQIRKRTNEMRQNGSIEFDGFALNSIDLSVKTNRKTNRILESLCGKLRLFESIEIRYELQYKSTNFVSNFETILRNTRNRNRTDRFRRAFRQFHFEVPTEQAINRYFLMEFAYLRRSMCFA